MDDQSMLPDLARNPVAWMITLFLAGLAWIRTLQQTAGMLSAQMYGTMGMSLLPFLFFWSVMMAAMMLPALAPIVSLHVEGLRHQPLASVARTLRLGAFLLGYLAVWYLFSLPVFLLGLLVDRIVLHIPLLGIGLGVLLFLTVGLYQITPWKQRCLNHCNPALGSHRLCFPVGSLATGLAHLKDGLSHGLFCVGCCGG
jgi:predicted metal-binding membrane protein